MSTLMVEGIKSFFSKHEIEVEVAETPTGWSVRFESEQNIDEEDAKIIERELDRQIYVFNTDSPHKLIWVKKARPKENRGLTVKELKHMLNELSAGCDDFPVFMEGGWVTLTKVKDGIVVLGQWPTPLKA